MTEDNPRFALGRLILEYIRAFLWPVVALVVVLVYQDDVRTILQEREVDIFGLRIGERVQEIESRARAEISDIQALLAEQQGRLAASGGSELISDIEVKLSSLEQNLSREVDRVRSVQVPSAPQPPASGAGSDNRAVRAAEAERRGFEALIARDLDRAAEAFAQARRIWPDYHNVAEISRLLRARGDTEIDWPGLYREILTKYSWGLPDDLRPALREGAAMAYR